MSDEGRRMPPHHQDDPRREPVPGSPRPEQAAEPVTGDALLGRDAVNLRQEWETIQAGFVDEPRQAVERADALVSRAAQRIADGFAQERERLEQHWTRGEDVSTEDLRMALRRYRAFFDRLLSI